MTDIEKKAREYALSGSILYEHFYTERARLGIVKFSGRDLEAAFLAGAAYALGNQWRDAEKEKPTVGKNLLLAYHPECDEYDIYIHQSNFVNGQYILDRLPNYIIPHERAVAWLEIPEYEPKGGDK